MFRKSHYLNKGNLWELLKPPKNGYPLTPLTNENQFRKFLDLYSDRVIAAIIYAKATPLSSNHVNDATNLHPKTKRDVFISSTLPDNLKNMFLEDSPILMKHNNYNPDLNDKSLNLNIDQKQDMMTELLLSHINNVNCGNPLDLHFCMIPGDNSPNIIKEFNIMAFPTTLIIHKHQLEHVIVGVKPKEIAIKTKFVLRLNNLNVFPE